MEVFPEIKIIDTGALRRLPSKIGRTLVRKLSIYPDGAINSLSEHYKASGGVADTGAEAMLTNIQAELPFGER